ncbi:MAG: chorismate synthase [Clostridia bacterium]|nr:chorismate synthase [Clostridia bacterium]
MQFKGNKLTVTVFGQSHAPAVGMVMDGLPAGIAVDRERLQAFMARRAPGQGSFTTARKEADTPEFLSGLAGNTTCGAPVCAVIRNSDTHSRDYSQFLAVPRPSHADYPARVKFGRNFDIRGGGQFSARLTAPLCAAGGIALQWLESKGIQIGAHIAAIAGIQDRPFDPIAVSGKDFDRVRENGFPVLDAEAGRSMLAAIEEARLAQDSVGGIVECAGIGLPVGLGDALFGGLESALSAGLFAIPAVKAVSFGSGFEAAALRGSQHNDPYILRSGRVAAATNHAGGIVGGMTTGMPLIIKAAFKPTPSIGQPQRSVNLDTMEETTLTITGRHDPCVVPRAVPVVEAVTALVLMDKLL